MTCSDYQRWISISLDGALNESQGSALKEHLEGCAECQAEREEQHDLRALLRSVPEPGPAGSVLSGLADRLDSQQARQVWLEDVERFAKRLVPIAAALLLVLSGIAARGVMNRLSGPPAIDWLLASSPPALTGQETDVWGLDWSDGLEPTTKQPER